MKNVNLQRRVDLYFLEVLQQGYHHVFVVSEFRVPQEIVYNSFYWWLSLSLKVNQALVEITVQN